MNENTLPYLLAYFSDHWFLGFVFLVLGAALLKCVIWYLPNRILRTINVLVRGWPPAHLDADGDWKPEPKPAAANKAQQ